MKSLRVLQKSKITDDVYSREQKLEYILNVLNEYMPPNESLAKGFGDTLYYHDYGWHYDCPASAICKYSDSYLSLGNPKPRIIGDLNTCMIGVFYISIPSHFVNGAVGGGCNYKLSYMLDFKNSITYTPISIFKLVKWIKCLRFLKEINYTTSQELKNKILTDTDDILRSSKFTITETGTENSGYSIKFDTTANDEFFKISFFPNSLSKYKAHIYLGHFNYIFINEIQIEDLYDFVKETFIINQIYTKSHTIPFLVYYNTLKEKSKEYGTINEKYSRVLEN